MIKIKRHHFIRLLLFATALPFGLLAADAMSTLAATVTVTGGNGANGAPGNREVLAARPRPRPRQAIPSNSATAIGGNGGNGGSGSEFAPRFTPQARAATVGRPLHRRPR